MRVHFAEFFNYSWNVTNKMRATISGPYIQWAKTTSTRARTSSENVILLFFNNFRLNFKYVLELNLNQRFIEKKTKRKISRQVLTLSTHGKARHFTSSKGRQRLWNVSKWYYKRWCKVCKTTCSICKFVGLSLKTETGNGNGNGNGNGEWEWGTGNL